MPSANKNWTSAAKRCWRGAGRKTEGYLKITRGMTTTPIGKRTSRKDQDLLVVGIASEGHFYDDNLPVAPYLAGRGVPRIPNPS